MSATTDATPMTGPEEYGEDLVLRAAERLGKIGRILDVDGIDDDDESADVFAADAERALSDGAEVVAAVRRAKHLASFAQQLADGVALDDAAVALIRLLANRGLTREAHGVAIGLAPATAVALEALAGGLVCHAAGAFADGWQFLRRVSVDDLVRLAPREAVVSGIAAGTAESITVAEEIAAHADELDSGVLVELAARFVVSGHQDLADDLVARVHARGEEGDPQVDGQQLALLDNLARWTHAKPEPESSSRLKIGIIDYHQVDYVRASRNLGDYIQTLAMLGNLARFGHVRYAGDHGLGELMTELQGRVRADLRLDGDPVDVQLVPVSRDFSRGDPIPEDTWMVAFGWHMHSTFRLGFGLPYHPNVRPIFISFHVNLVEALTPDAIDYLKAHGPIGCRDWTTVDLLLSAGVDAFFSGCLTTTIDAVFPPTADVAAQPEPAFVAAVDIGDVQASRIEGRVERISHIAPEYRDADLATGVHAASALVDRYQSEFTEIVTSRLHCYLPVTSLGVDVRFKPRNASDVRFDGLRNLKADGPGFRGMRDRIRSSIAETFALVLQGAPEEQVYARWRELTAGQVEEARRRVDRAAKVEPDEVDLAPFLGGVVVHERGVAAADALDIVVAAEPHDADRVLVLVESVVSTSASPVRVRILGPGLDGAYADRLAAAFPDVAVSVLDTSEATGDGLGPDVARLLLPALLPGSDRVVLLSPDCLVDGDLTPLARVDLGGHALAARSTTTLAANLWRDGGDDLPPKVASDLRRQLSARQPFGVTVIDPDVLVLDLARLREERFVEETVPLMSGHFGLPWVSVLVAHVGADRVELDPAWNTLVGREPVIDPVVLNFRAVGDPALPGLVPERERWVEHAARLAVRTSG